MAPRRSHEKEKLSMDHSPMRPDSHLFTVRVWQAETETDQREWRGKVQLLTNGDARYFRGWTALVPLLQTMLSDFGLDSSKGEK